MDQGIPPPSPSEFDIVVDAAFTKAKHDSTAMRVVTDLAVERDLNAKLLVIVHELQALANRMYIRGENAVHVEQVNQAWTYVISARKCLKV